MILRGVALVLMLVYPLIVWFGLQSWGLPTLVPLMVCLLGLRLFTLRNKLGEMAWLGKIAALSGIVLVVASGVLRQHQLLLYYPVVVNVLLLSLFFYSLFRPATIVERFARLSDPHFPPQAIVYTRRVTKVWCFFFLINGGIALYTCLRGDMSWWALYNGGISYLLMGLLMGVEWLVRKKVQQHY